jgi:hypothetical protein
MRFASLSVLLLSTVTLTACGGGGSTLIEMNDRCGTNCAKTTKAPPVVPITAETPNGQVLPDASTVNTGNNVQIPALGETAIVLEKNKLINTRATPALTRFTPDTGTTSETKTAKLEIDTKSSRNSTWPTPKSMLWYRFGSQNYIKTARTVAVLDPSAPDTETAGSIGLAGGVYNEYRALSNVDATPFDESLQVWTWGKSYGIQYRDVTAGGGSAAHQAWTYGANSGQSKTNAADLPTAADYPATNGKVTFTGEYTSTAETSNFDPRDLLSSQTMGENGHWSVRGDASITIDFGASKSINGTLDPKVWRKYQDANGKKGFEYVDVERAKVVNASPRSPAWTPRDLRDGDNYFSFMDDQVILKGSLLTAAPPATPATPGAPTTPTLTSGNEVTNGTAFFNENAGIVTNTTTNLFFGSIFGTPATGGMEFTGVFNVEGKVVDPYGGDIGINDDRRATVSQSGLIHVEDP